MSYPTAPAITEPVNGSPLANRPAPHTTPPITSVGTPSDAIARAATALAAAEEAAVFRRPSHQPPPMSGNRGCIGLAGAVCWTHDNHDTHQPLRRPVRHVRPDRAGRSRHPGP